MDKKNPINTPSKDGAEDFSLGREIPEPIFVPAEVEHTTVPIPTEPTSDKLQNQDGGTHPWKPKGR